MNNPIPQNDELIQESLTLANYAGTASLVVDADSERQATEFLVQVKDQLNKIDRGRRELVDPLNAHVKTINAKFKQLSDPLTAADAHVRATMTAYRNSEAFKAKVAERQEIEARARQAVAEGDIQALQALAPEHALASEAAGKKSVSESGEARFRKTWRYEIVDESLIPKAFWIVDEKKLAQVVKTGLPIEGVKSWQEETPIII